MIAVNTTAGTASEITRFCIITDTSRHVKMAIVDWRVTPQIAINDPNLMVGMPPALTAATGVYMKARDKMAYGQYLAGIAFKYRSELPIVLSQWASCFIDLVTYYLHRR